jgi:AraC-like DNA-binding protein
MLITAVRPTAVNWLESFAADDILPSGRASYMLKGFRRMTLPYAMAYAPPPPHLADRVSSFYEFSNPALHHEDVERSDRQQLRVMLQGEGSYIFANGQEYAAPRVSLNGPTTGHIRQVARGPILMVGAGLLPTAWQALIGRDTDAYVDRCIDARDILGDCVDDLWQAVTAAPDQPARFAALADFITQVTMPADPEHVRFITLVDSWLTENADPHVDALVSASGYGVRKLERLTKRYYGVPPKTLARKYRALRAAAALARGEDLASIGMGDSFYDQSHLIREVKRFAGLTPVQIRERQSRLTTEIALGRATMRGQVSPLVSEA